jgi:transposase-like protein
MPSKIDKIKINNPELDRRVKLTPEDKLEIQSLYKSGGYSQRDLARLFNVSRRSIVFAIYPERRVANYENKIARGGHSKLYYDKDKHSKAMKKHREYKKELLEQKLI